MTVLYFIYLFLWFVAGVINVDNKEEKGFPSFHLEYMKVQNSAKVLDSVL